MLLSENLKIMRQASRKQEIVRFRHSTMKMDHLLKLAKTENKVKMKKPEIQNTLILGWIRSKMDNLLSLL